MEGRLLPLTHYLVEVLLEERALARFLATVKCLRKKTSVEKSASSVAIGFLRQMAGWPEIESEE